MAPYPLHQAREMQLEAMKELVDAAGSNAQLARMLGVPTSTVNSWVERGRISKKGAELVQTNVHLKHSFPISKLRPEL